MNEVIKSKRPIYELATSHMRTVANPVTVSQLMEIAEIREEALRTYAPENQNIQRATNQLSNALGLMCRRGILRKHPAPRASKSRAWYAYSVAPTDDIREQPIEPMPTPYGRSVPKPAKPVIRLTDSGDSINIELGGVVLSIRA